MRIVFLDFDGVLNSIAGWRDRALLLRQKLSRLEWQARQLEPELVERLNQIIDATSAKVVVSSSWRHGFSADELQQILELAGFTGDVIDVTPDAQGEGLFERRRPVAIYRWLEQYRERLQVSAYVVLDDIDMSDYFGDEFVLTEHRHGLQPQHVEKAIEVLNR
jgi:hypothetical protein